MRCSRTGIASSGRPARAQRVAEVVERVRVGQAGRSGPGATTCLSSAIASSYLPWLIRLCACSCICAGSPLGVGAGAGVGVVCERVCAGVVCGCGRCVRLLLLRRRLLASRRPARCPCRSPPLDERGDRSRRPRAARATSAATGIQRGAPARVADRRRQRGAAAAVAARGGVAASLRRARRRDGPRGRGLRRLERVVEPARELAGGRGRSLRIARHRALQHLGRRGRSVAPGLADVRRRGRWRSGARSRPGVRPWRALRPLSSSKATAPSA